ncbi:secretory carrier-associated membrane protein 3 isoform X2 [Platichthys flesus]|uniref:secretory carrier-associated membrane protein 3 isoform X2 n=1 Tax=Platichthys flesus TaxID=8260 RepID=UPI002DBAF067|nr:secretory carrier-associated membrane protein 3 isoform X2 [Platichthys flesus]
MSKYTSFPDAAEDHNPFQDPAVTQHSSNTGYATLDLYNPFDNTTTGPPPPYEATSPTAAPVPAQTPPSRTTPTEPRNYGSYTSQTAVNATTAELLRKQEELEKKAQELERRERELESHSLGPGASRQNNWPPLPSFCPVGPCFYQDINVEITQRFQRTVTIMYYFWMFSACTLVFNLISSLAMFCVDPSGGVGLGLAILWGLLFTPCSFVCWYRPMYKAFRSINTVLRAKAVEVELNISRRGPIKGRANTENLLHLFPFLLCCCPDFFDHFSGFSCELLLLKVRVDIGFNFLSVV